MSPIDPQKQRFGVRGVVKIIFSTGHKKGRRNGVQISSRGTPWGVLGALLAPLGALLGASCAPQGGQEVPLGVPGGVLVCHFGDFLSSLCTLWVP